MSKIVLIGGYPKGYNEPFHIKTTSGRILRKIVADLNIDPIYFDLWDNKGDEDLRKLSGKTKKKLLEFEKNNYTLISLGKYIEKVLIENKIKTQYLPHPASRDRKYIDILKRGLELLV